MLSDFGRGAELNVDGDVGESVNFLANGTKAMFVIDNFSFNFQLSEPWSGRAS